MTDNAASMTPLQKAVVALKALRARNAELEAAASAPIAIIGIGCRYPAGGTGPDALWQAMFQGRDGAREVPADRWDIDAVYDPAPGAPGKMYVRKSCFIDGVDRFDPLFFRISPREAVGIDPQQRLLLEVSWEAMEDAGIDPNRLVGSRTGVFLGISTNDYSALLSKTAMGSGSNATAGAGNAASVASGRISYTFGFQGPCFAIDTACSSSLVATHQAVRSLRSGESSLALVAGVNLMLAPDITINFCQGRMLSPDGACKTFDAGADGYVRGEGCGVLVLKRLTDAQADGDRVIAVIKGSALNQDGRSAGLTAPNGLAQEAVIRAALADAGLTPADIDYIEAHGTGTSLGDPIEMQALKAVFGRDRDRPLHIGSVKTNIGHCEAAAGVAGLIKAALTLRNGTIPPNLHFTALNPHIDLSGVDFRIPTSAVAGGVARAGVSSFGFSGTNAHIVLEAAPPPAPVAPRDGAASKLFISARTPEALAVLVDRYRAHLATSRDSFADICFSAATGRARMQWWVCVDRAADLSQAPARNDAPPVLPALSGRRVDLPSYPFQRDRYWIDSGPVTEEPTFSKASWPGTRIRLPHSRQVLIERWVHSGDPDWAFLADHRVNDQPVLPAAFFASLALAARPDHAVADLRLTAPYIVPAGPDRVMQMLVEGDGAFRIQSFRADDGEGEPVLHATGRLEPTGPVPGTLSLPTDMTDLSASDLYAAMAATGVRHGPSMQVLRHVRRTDGAAQADLTAPPGDASLWPHPAALDAALSLVGASLPAANGQLLVPAGIGRIMAWRRPNGTVQVRCTARRKGDVVTARVEMADAAGPVLCVDDLRFTAAAGAGPHGFHARVWRDAPLRGWAGPADFIQAAPVLADFLSGEARILGDRHGMAAYADSAADLESLAARAIVGALQALGFDFTPSRAFTIAPTAEALGIADRHARLFRRMIAILTEEGILARQGMRWVVARRPDPVATVAIQAEADDLCRQYPALGSEIATFARCTTSLADVLRGDIDPLGLLFPAQGSAGAGAFYDGSPYACTINGLVSAAFGRLMADRPPARPLRILEIGAGTGGATGAALAALGDTPFTYLFTDISAGFLAAARQRFADHPLDTAILDIESDPLAQGFTEGGYDVVMAANVLHATQDIAISLGHARRLLAPGGMLILVESGAPRRWVDLVFGLTPGWWRFTDTALRPDHPLLDGDRWSRVLTQAGFVPGLVAGSDIITASVPLDSLPESGPALYLDGDCPSLARALVRQGGRVRGMDDAAHWVRLLPPTALDADAQMALLADLAELVRTVTDHPGLPRLTLIGRADAGHAGLSGFVRSLALEQPDLRPRLILTDDPEAFAATLAADLLLNGEGEEEVRVDATGRAVARLVPAATASGAVPPIHGTWAITGGFGGLGLEVARWLAGQGAAKLLLIGRRPPGDMPDMGVPVIGIAGDVADTDVIRAALRDHGPVTGIIHAAGVLANVNAMALSQNTIARVLRPKIAGSLALDRAARTAGVEHFILFASAAGILGSARQSNHAFASAFLDGLAAARRTDGLPALSLDWGVWRRIGAAARQGFDLQADQLGLGGIDPDVGIRAFAASLSSRLPALTVLPSVDWPAFLANFDDAAPRLYAELTRQARAPAPAPLVAAAQPMAAYDPVAAVTRIVASVLNLTGTIDPRLPLHEYGLDSLVAVEIKNRAQAELGVDLSVRDLIEGASIQAIAAKLPRPTAPVATTQAIAAGPDPRARLTAIVAELLGIKGTVDPKIPLYELGLDSLVAVEIKNRVERDLGHTLSVRDLIEGASIERLLASLPGSVAPVEKSEPVTKLPMTGRSIVPDPANRFAPFPLTEMQQAYWLGRRDDVELGNVGCYLYTEFDTTQVDIGRVERAWNILIRRHDMLRMVVTADGQQRILPEVPEYRFQITDLRGQHDADVQLEDRRRTLARRLAPVGSWPLFDIQVTWHGDGIARIHTGIDLMALDAASIHALRVEWGRLYEDLDVVLPPLTLSFRDCVMEEVRHRQSPAWTRSEDYWRARLDHLPGGPDLPVQLDRAASGNAGFTRHRVIIDRDTARDLAAQAQAHGLTLSTLLAASYADILAAWCRSAHFCLTVTSFNRPPLHPEIGSVIGDFTGTLLLQVDASAPGFAGRAQTLSRQLAADLDHGDVSGVHVLRLMNRHQGGAMRYVPVVFTSALGFRRNAAPETAATGWDRLGSTVYNVSSTPQVWIDQQISEEEGALLCNWDVVEALFPTGMVPAMVAGYEHMLRGLAAGRGWDRPVAASLPPLSRTGLVPIVDTGLLYDGIVEQARLHPDRVAIIDADGALDFRTLDRASDFLASDLSAQLGGVDAARDRLVAICFAKGWRQVVAAFAILKAGAAYLPIDPALPADRRHLLIDRAQAMVLDDPAALDRVLDRARGLESAPPLPPVNDPTRLAYVIYTSGSTGVPKGVMIEHRAARVTVDEINRRWNVGPEDRVLGLSALNFDLSVYDIFGPLAVGGAVVLPPPKAARDPGVWARLLVEHRVTLWNTVPALMAMLVEHGMPRPHALRLVMMSGDWVPLDLVHRLRPLLPDATLVALGGATEAAIWSNAHEIGDLDPNWSSIPYGTPLVGHDLHVVNDRGQDCPDMVVGEIEISGQGLARGYLHEPDLTAERFRIDPLTGQRRYRTGDLGRFRPYTTNPPDLATPIEFLGREDFQVKLQGHRIELGEVESVLCRHADVASAVAIVRRGNAGEGDSLHAFIIPADRPAPIPPHPLIDRVAAAAQDAAEQTARPGQPERIDAATFDDLIGRLSDNAAAAAAQALRHLTGGAGITDPSILIDHYGVAPRYCDWLTRMAPEVARVGQDAIPRPGAEVDPVNRLGFGGEALGLMEAVIADLPDILTERRHSATIYLSDETPAVYARLFAAPNRIIRGALAAALAGAGRTLSILEVGGGLGTTLAALEPVLAGADVAYHFTDVSRHMVSRAAALFGHLPGFTADLLDINQPVSADAPRHDIIIATSAMHVASDVATAVSGLAARLAPGGMLILLEQTRFFPWFDLNMGLQAGFDDRTDRGLRPSHPLLSQDQWRDLLATVGLGDVRHPHVAGSLSDRLGFDVLIAQAGKPAILGIQVTGQADRMDAVLNRLAVRAGAGAANRTGRIALPSADLDPVQWHRRTCARHFRAGSVPLSALGALLSVARALDRPGTVLPKYRYPSAGSTYPVQLWLLIADGQVEGVPGGLYYHHPDRHDLEPVMPGAELPASLHAARNQALAANAAFTLLLVADRRGSSALYGDLARDFSLIEAGAMLQLLLEAAPDTGLGLCPIGALDNAPDISALDLGGDRELLHLVLGALADGPAANAGDLSARLLAFAASQLPSYMVPRGIGMVEHWPLSANGKVDRTALAALAGQPQVRAPKTGLSAVERAVAEQVALLLDNSAADPDRSLFDLGATSLTLVSLQRRLSEHLGRRVGLQALFEQPTIRAIARAIETGQAGTGAIVGFDTRPPAGDTRPRLILMPGVFALPFYLRDLAAMLADDVALLSVQLPGMFGAEVPLDNIEAQADHVLTELRRVQPVGPYLLGGHSYGGCVAIEVARRLRAAGEAVPLLLLGDTVRTVTQLTAFQRDEIALTAMTRGLYALYGDHLAVPYAALDGLEPAAKFDRTAGALATSGVLGPLTLPIDRMVAMFKANLKALGDYRPQPIDGDVTLLRTQGGMPVEFLDHEPDDSIRDPGLGWTALVHGHLDVRTIPGDHLSLLDADNLPVMADVIRDLVRRAVG